MINRKFKVGDRVKISEPWEGYERYRNSSGIIYDIGNFYDVRFDNGEEDCFHFCEMSLEKKQNWDL